MANGLTAPPQIETPRLLLARPEPADAEAMFARYASDPGVTRYLGWPTHRSVADTRDFLAFADAEWQQDGVGPYLVWRRRDGALLGSTGLDRDGDGATTGYVLAKDAWGRGYATEVLVAMVQLARDLGLRRIAAFCHPAHRASRHVLEKGGFEQDSRWVRQIVFPNLERGAPEDLVRYERTLRS